MLSDDANVIPLSEVQKAEFLELLLVGTYICTYIHTYIHTGRQAGRQVRVRTHTHTHTRRNIHT
jgi:hypothetical protein